LSCGIGDTQLGPSAAGIFSSVLRRYWPSSGIAELAGLAAILCRSRDDPAAANPATPLLTLRWKSQRGVYLPRVKKFTAKSKKIERFRAGPLTFPSEQLRK
jgi:hypothetical protein